MLKLIILAITIFSLNANAVMNSKEVNWIEYDTVVMISNENSYCSGMALSGKYILTAAHCNSMTEAKSESGIYSLLGGEDHQSLDISIKKAVKSLEYSSLTPILLKENLTSVPVKIFGFGGTKAVGFLPLFITSSKGEAEVEGDLTSEAYSIGGDSGGPWLNQNGEIVALHSGGHIDIALDGTETYITRGTNLYSARDFILDTINGWHYPTVIDLKGETKITLQSLHQTGSDLANSYRVEGDVEVVPSSSCLTDAIAPFSVCELSIISTGGTGKVYLSEDEVIVVNKEVKQPTNSDSDEPSTNTGSKSGGSMGVGVLLMLVLLLCRKCPVPGYSFRNRFMSARS